MACANQDFVIKTDLHLPGSGADHVYWDRLLRVGDGRSLRIAGGLSAARERSFPAKWGCSGSGQKETNCRVCPDGYLASRLLFLNTPGDTPESR